MSEIWTAIKRDGLKEYFRQFYRLRCFKGGELIGTDELGNKYYEVKDERFKQAFRNRYVEYANGAEEATLVTSKWYAWLHCMTDDVPGKDFYTEPITYTGHESNLTGTSWRYVPRSTTGPKYSEYVENKREEQNDQRLTKSRANAE